jgi:hypothetical protein
MAMLMVRTYRGCKLPDLPTVDDERARPYPFGHSAHPPPMQEEPSTCIEAPAMGMCRPGFTWTCAPYPAVVVPFPPTDLIACPILTSDLRFRHRPREGRLGYEVVITTPACTLKDLPTLA